MKTGKNQSTTDKTKDTIGKGTQSLKKLRK